MREGWRRLSVADAVVMAKRGRAPVYVEGGGEPVLSQKCVRDGRVNERLARRADVSKRQVPEWAWVQPGDTLVNSTGRGTVGRAGFVTNLAGRATADSHLTIVRPKPTVVIPAYLGILLHAAKDALESMASGSTNQTELSPDSILSIPILLPPLDEQRRIVDLISAVDEAIEAAEGVAKQSSTFENSLRGELLEAMTSAASVPISQVVEITTGRQRSPKHAHGAYMVRYMRAANIKDGKLAVDAPQYMNFTSKEQAKYLLQAGDVLVTEGCGSLSQIGASCEWNEEVPGVVCFQNHVLRLRTLRQNTVVQRLVYHWALWNFHSGRFADIATGTNIFSLGSGRVEKLPFPVAELPEQEETIFFLDAATECSSAAKGSAARLSALRSSLLADLLSGDHEIPASYDELLSA